MTLASLYRCFRRSGRPPAATLPKPEAGGDAETQFLRGVQLASQEGVEPDYLQAAQWYELAAAQNHSLAQFNLAVMYSQGQGVARDEAKARMWMTRAANLGDAAAQYKLGVQQHRSCQEGRTGTQPEDRIESLKWVRLAAAQGYRGAARACEQMTLTMTWEEVAEGARRASSFVAG